jgi:hypothetical protein
VRRALKAKQQTELVRDSEPLAQNDKLRTLKGFRTSRDELERAKARSPSRDNREIDRDGRAPKSSTYLQKGGDPAAPSDTATLLRLHPSYQSLLKDLPPLRVSAAISGATDSHGVTGGVYKARERIHPCLLIRDY